MPDVVTPTLHRSLGDLVAEVPARSRVLERAGLDYCCHGKRTLAVAAAAAGLDADALATELAGIADTTGRDVDALGPVELVEHLLATHHAYLHEELPALRALATKVQGAHGSRHPELAEVTRLVTAIADDLEPHMRKEEQILFPAITHRFGAASPPAPGSLAAPIRVMEADHEAVGALLEQLRTTTAGYTVPADGCASYQALYARLADLETDTFRHVHLENNVLFPQVLAAP